MRTIYLNKKANNIERKVLIDMAYLVSHKQIRLLKTYFEDGLYLKYKNSNEQVEQYPITKDKIIKEDQYHYYFEFPFKPAQVEDTAV